MRRKPAKRKKDEPSTSKSSQLAPKKKVKTQGKVEMQSEEYVCKPIVYPQKKEILQLGTLVFGLWQDRFFYPAVVQNVRMGQKYSYDIMFLDGNAGKNLTNQNLVVCELPPIGADVMIENKDGLYDQVVIEGHYMKGHELHCSVVGRDHEKFGRSKIRFSNKQLKKMLRNSKEVSKTVETQNIEDCKQSMENAVMDRSVSVENQTIQDNEELMTVENQTIQDNEELMTVENQTIQDKEELMTVENQTIQDKEELMTVENQTIQDNEELMTVENQTIQDKEELMTVENQTIQDNEELMTVASCHGDLTNKDFENDEAIAKRNQYDIFKEIMDMCKHNLGNTSCRDVKNKRTLKEIMNMCMGSTGIRETEGSYTRTECLGDDTEKHFDQSESDKDISFGDDTDKDLDYNPNCEDASSSELFSDSECEYTGGNEEIPNVKRTRSKKAIEKSPGPKKGTHKSQKSNGKYIVQQMKASLDTNMITQVKGTRVTVLGEVTSVVNLGEIPGVESKPKRKYNKSVCQDCGQSVFRLRRHERLVHNAKKKQSVSTLYSAKDRRPMKYCPIANCSFASQRIDRHLLRKHKFSKHDKEYKMLCIKAVKSKHRESTILPSFNAVQKLQSFNELTMASTGTSFYTQPEKNIPSSYPTTQTHVLSYYNTPYGHVPDFSCLEEEVNRFCLWLMSLSGGGKAEKEARQMTSQVKRIMADSEITDTTLLIKTETLDKIEAKFIQSNLMCKKLSASSINLYLWSLTHFCTFLKERKGLHVDIVCKKIDRWKKSLKKEVNAEKLQKKAQNRETAVDVSVFSAYNKSHPISLINELIQEEMNKPTRRGHDMTREYLILNIVIHNANRTGGIVQLTQKVYETATYVQEKDSYVLEIFRHKTSMAYGQLDICLPTEIFKIMTLYNNIYRPHILKGDLTNDDQQFFLNWGGSGVTHTGVAIIMTKGLSKVGCSDRVTCTKIRHACVTMLHKMYRHEGGLKTDIAAHMKHSNYTAQCHYNDADMLTQAASTSTLISKILQNQTIYLSDIEADTVKSSDEVLLPADVEESSQITDENENMDEIRQEYDMDENHDGICTDDDMYDTVRVHDIHEVTEGMCSNTDWNEEMESNILEESYKRDSYSEGREHMFFSNEINLHNMVQRMKRSGYWEVMKMQSKKSVGHLKFLMERYEGIKPANFFDVNVMQTIVRKEIDWPADPDQHTRFTDIVCFDIAYRIAKKKKSPVGGSCGETMEDGGTNSIDKSAHTHKKRTSRFFDEDQRSYIKNLFKEKIKKRQKCKVGEAREMLINTKGCAEYLFGKSAEELSRTEITKLSTAVIAYSSKI